MRPYNEDELVLKIHEPDWRAIVQAEIDKQEKWEAEQKRWDWNEEEEK